MLFRSNRDANVPRPLKIGSVGGSISIRIILVRVDHSCTITKSLTNSVPNLNLGRQIYVPVAVQNVLSKMPGCDFRND